MATDKQPLVSIVLPTFNGARYLAQSVESCLGQTLADFELILIDDASTDATPEIIRSFRDPRIVAVRHDSNRGLAASLNHGFELSRGRYLTWTSDDNYYAPEALATMAAFLDGHDKVAFVYSNYHFIDENGRTVRPGKIRDSGELDDDNCVGSCFLYRRCVYEKLGGYNTAAALVEDYEYWLRVRKNFCMARIDPFLYFHRHHPASLTMTHRDEEIQDRIHAVRRSFISDAKYGFFEGQRAFRRGDRGRALSQVCKSIALQPFFPAAWRLLARILFQG